MFKTLFKGLFTAIAVLGLVLTAGSLLLPAGFQVERRIVIAAPAERVFDEVADPRRWKDWSVWTRRDPAMQIRYEGAASGAGAIWAWTSASEGQGRMHFTAAEAPRRLAYELSFEGFSGASQGEMQLAPVAGGTELRWSMQGHLGGNPMFRWVTLFAGRRVGGEFDDSLAALKARLERR
jgi:uncharacterized protein YndB with AHSA1/START domain